MTTCTDLDPRAGIMSSITFFTRVNASKQILNANVASRELWSLSAIADNSSEACVLRSECRAIDFCSNESLKVLVNKSWSSSLIKIAVSFNSLSISNWRVFWWWWMLNLLYVASYLCALSIPPDITHLFIETFLRHKYSAFPVSVTKVFCSNHSLPPGCVRHVFFHQWGYQSGVSSFKLYFRIFQNDITKACVWSVAFKFASSILDSAVSSA